jgi:hypothetical protein
MGSIAMDEELLIREPNVIEIGVFESLLSCQTFDRAEG